jgi:hypothetical protein
MKRTKALMIAACVALGGCTTLTDYGVVRKDALRNDQGHIIGSKELLRNERTGEVVAQVAMFTPLRSESGAIVGYEEQARSGSIIRDLDGNRIGQRFADLRSRGTNSKGRGLTIVFRPADAPKVATAQPRLLDLLASLSASDLRRIQ